jgi:hypothetical protein
MSKICVSTHQQINTKSSTEAELVRVDDGMHLVVWTRNFLSNLGYKVCDNVLYQDNQCATLLERNGKASSGRRTRHINIRYFSVTDRIKMGDMQVEYCPTGDMIGDFFTKPLQGSLFKKFRAAILHIPDSVPLPLTTTGPQECVEETKTWADVVRGSETWSGHRPSNMKDMSTSIIKSAIATTREIKLRQQ